MNNTLFVEFEMKLNSLRDFPDRDAIMRITKFAEDHVNVASHIVNIMAAKVIDPATNITYKLPIFYCMDSIMKNVGGPYAVLFSRHLAEVFARAFDEVSIKDKEKLAKMLQYWEERAILPKEVMVKMRFHVTLRQSTVIPPTAVVMVPTVPPIYEQPSIVPMQIPMVHQQQQQQQPVMTTPPINYQMQPQVTQTIDRYIPDNTRTAINATASTVARMIPDTHIIPQLQPPPLHQQQQQQQQQFRRQDQRTNTRFTPPTADGRRNIPPTYTTPPTHKQASSPIHHQQQQQPVAGRGAQRMFNRQSQQPQQQQQQHQQKPYPRSQQPLIAIAPDQQIRPLQQQSHHHQQQQQQHSQHQQKVMVESNNVVSMDTSHLINAFICEKPVLINLNLAKAVLNQLITFNITTNTNNPFMNTKRLNELQPSQSQPPLQQQSSGISQQLDTVIARFHDLIENVNVRPQLPSILFGPLPLEPSKHFTEQLQQQNKLIEQESIRANKKQKIILPVPKFRVEDLLKKPVRAVNLLYSDRPHQYAEDGVRFKTLQDLAVYTDISLTKKEVNKKKDIAGEKIYRAWYSTALQWVHDTSSIKGNVKSNASTTAATTSSVSSSSGSSSNSSNSNEGDSNSCSRNSKSTDDNETYILPADDQFPRCVICKESFATTWDKDEGELYFKNAIRLLVTQKADIDLFQQSAPTAHDMVNYCIVHKDGCSMEEFLEQGRADTLRKTKLRYKNMPMIVDMLMTAAGLEEDEDDIFCMLEHS